MHVSLWLIIIVNCHQWKISMKMLGFSHLMLWDLIYNLRWIYVFIGSLVISLHGWWTAIWGTSVHVVMAPSGKLHVFTQCLNSSGMICVIYHLKVFWTPSVCYNAPTKGAPLTVWERYCEWLDFQWSILWTKELNRISYSFEVATTSNASVQMVCEIFSLKVFVRCDMNRISPCRLSAVHH